MMQNNKAAVAQQNSPFGGNVEKVVELLNLSAMAIANGCPTINNLPNEVLLNIFSYLTVEDLVLNIQQVCSRWSELSFCDALWKHSVFNPPFGASENCIISVLKKAPKLECLDVEYASPLILQWLAECCKDLRKLKFDILHPNEGNEVFEKLVLHCPKLEELSIPGRTLFNREVFEHIAKLTNLRAIYLNGKCPQVSLEPIADNCPSLELLHMGEANWIHFDVKYFLQKKQNKLVSLGIMPTSKEKVCVLPLLAAYGKGLRELRLEGGMNGYDPDTFRAIRTISSLESLTLMFTYGLAADIMASVFIGKAMSQLLKLEISNSREMNDGLLHTICMNCPNLVKLALQCSFELNDEGLKFLSLCENLEELDVSECTALTDTAMAYISRCSKLKRLNISECQPTCLGLSYLLELSDLTHLDISCCEVTGLRVDLIPKCFPKLRKLRIEAHRGIEEETLSALCRKMPYLRVDLL